MKSKLKNFTTVVTENQTAGRGQMGTNWISEKGKNLTFSVLIDLKSFEIRDQFYLSMSVSLGIYSVLMEECDTKFYIKWPNDILAVKDKVAGVLIENIIGGAYIKHSIVGIGLNVNQENFPNEITNVSSLKRIGLKDYNLDELLLKIINSVQYFVSFIEKKEFSNLKKMYLEQLFMINKPAMFEDIKGRIFLGKIVNVSEAGMLMVELENEKIRKFNLKEIKFANR